MKRNSIIRVLACLMVFSLAPAAFPEASDYTTLWTIANRRVESDSYYFDILLTFTGEPENFKVGELSFWITYNEEALDKASMQFSGYDWYGDLAVYSDWFTKIGPFTVEFRSDQEIHIAPHPVYADNLMIDTTLLGTQYADFGYTAGLLPLTAADGPSHFCTVKLDIIDDSKPFGVGWNLDNWGLSRIMPDSEPENITAYASFEMEFTPTPSPPPTATPPPTIPPTPPPTVPPIATPSAAPTSTVPPAATPTPAPAPTSIRLVVDWDDYSGDGRTDIAVYVPETGVWNIRGVTEGLVWGGEEGDVPAPGDYDGDLRADLGIFNRVSGQWKFIKTTGEVITTGVQWGVAGDLPVPGNYTGDGTTDLAVWRPSTGRWYIRDITTAHWGWPGDIPVPGDYDGDGTTDIAALRPSSGIWFVRGIGNRRWHIPGDVAMPMDFAGDGTTELGVYRPSSGIWWILGLKESYPQDLAVFRWGVPERGDIPAVGDFDGDGAADPTCFRPGENQWYIYSSSGPYYAVGFSAQTTDSIVTGATSY